MTFPPQSANPMMRPKPIGRSPEDRVVYAIGSRIFIKAASPDQKRVELMDDKGHPSGIMVALDTPAEVTAWRPQRAAAARYRVRCDGNVEGWIDAANVRQPPRVVPPKPVLPPAPAKKAPARAGAKAGGKASTKTTTTAAAKTAASKVVPPAPVPAAAPAKPTKATAAPKPAAMPARAKPAPAAKKAAARRPTTAPKTAAKTSAAAKKPAAKRSK